MNPHFSSSYERDQMPPLPRSGYARMDDLEISRNGSTARVSFDMVDADWVNKYLPLKDSNPRIVDFENMPLFHLEIVINFINYRTVWPQRYLPLAISSALHRRFLGGPWQSRDFPDPTGLSPNPSLWFFIEQTRKWRGHRANLYRNMSGDVESINVDVQPSDVPKELNQIFTLPGTSVNTLDPAALALIGDTVCDRIVVFDVGQGNANGMVKNGSVAPELYFDAGAGVYGNFHTRPRKLHLPADNARVVILSHWDSDHWAGANIPGNDELLSRTWIAPNQTVGPRHAAFAQRIIDNSGTLLLMEKMAPTVQVIPIKGGVSCY